VKQKSTPGVLRVLSPLLLATSLVIPATIAAHDEQGAEAADTETEAERYPTHAIADYVLACMSANGNTFQSLHQCSCSIDHIMSKISYTDFEKASTILQVQLDKGQRGVFYRDSHWAKNNLDRFERVQAESTLKCF